MSNPHGLPEPDPCRWTRDQDGTEWLIPGCIGTAVTGPQSCTCDTPLSRIERAEALVRKMHDHHERLRERLLERNLEIGVTHEELRVLTARVRMIESAR